MNSLRTILCAACLCLLLPLTGSAQTDSLSMLLQVSHIESATLSAGPPGLDGLPDMLAMCVNHLGVQLSDAQLNGAVAEIPKSVTSKDLTTWLHASFEKNLPASSITPLVRQYATPLFARMAIAESTPLDEATMQEFRKFSGNASNFEDTTRSNLAKLMESSGQVSSATLHAQIAFVRAFLEGANEALGEKERFTPENIESMIGQFEQSMYDPKVAQQRTDASVKGLLFCYRAVSTPDLASYISYWQTPIGHSLNIATSRSLSDIARETGLRFGRETILYIQSHTK